MAKNEYNEYIWIANPSEPNGGHYELLGPSGEDFNNLVNIPHGTLTITSDGREYTFTDNDGEDVTVEITGSGAVSDATITLSNGDGSISYGDFTLNQGTDETINIPVPTVNDGTLTIYKNSQTTENKLGEFTANQSSATNVVIPIPTVNDSQVTIKNGSTSIGSFTTNQASNSEIDLNISVPTVNDSTITLKNGTDTLGSFTTNASSGSDINIPISNATITLKKSLNETIGSFNLNQTTGKNIIIPIPTVNDAQISITNGNGQSLGTFTLNQASSQSVTIPDFNSSQRGLVVPDEDTDRQRFLDNSGNWTAIQGGGVEYAVYVMGNTLVIPSTVQTVDVNIENHAITINNGVLGLLQ